MEDYTTKYLKYLRTTSIKIGLITFYITSFGILGDLFFEYLVFLARKGVIFFKLKISCNPRFASANLFHLRTNILPYHK